MMEAAHTSETSVDIKLRTWQYIPEDSELHTRCDENLKSPILCCLCEPVNCPIFIRSNFFAAIMQKNKALLLHAVVALGGERRYSSYSFLISALDGVNG
jgi:hypothetical protein